MKFNKIISTITAFAIATSMMVGFSGISASAATNTLINLDFQSGAPTAGYYQFDGTAGTSSDYGYQYAGTVTADTLTNSNTVMNMQTGGKTSTYTLKDAATSGIITYEADMFCGSLTNRYAYMRIKNSGGTTIAEYRFNRYNGNHYFNVNAVACDGLSTSNIFAGSGSNTSIENEKGNMFHSKIEVNLATGIVTGTLSKGTTTNVVTGTLPANLRDCKVFELNTNYDNTNRPFFYDNLKVTHEEISATTVDIVVKYQDIEGNPIRANGSATAVEGEAYTYNVSAQEREFDKLDGANKVCRYFLNEASSTLSIASPSSTANEIILKYDTVNYADITVNNYVGDTSNIIETYNGGKILVTTGTFAGNYDATYAQKGYKTFDGKRYVLKDGQTTSWAVQENSNTWDLEFVELENDDEYIIYEDFCNISDNWGFVNAKTGSVVRGGNYLGITQYNQGDTALNTYGHLYTDIKEFGSDIISLTSVSIEFDWSSQTEINKNRTNAFEIRDNANNIIFSLFSDATKGVSYNLGAMGNAEDTTLIENSKWTTGTNTSGIYKINLDIDFLADGKASVSGSIAGGKAEANITIPETEIDAINVGKLTAGTIYSLAPQNLYKLTVKGEYAPSITSAIVNSTGYSAPAGDTEIKNPDGNTAGTWSELITEPVVLTTVVIVIQNPVDGLTPTLKINGETFTASASVGGNDGTYIYQIASDDELDLTGATVEYGDLSANVTVE